MSEIDSLEPKPTTGEEAQGGPGILLRLSARILLNSLICIAVVLPPSPSTPPNDIPSSNRVEPSDVNLEGNLYLLRISTGIVLDLLVFIAVVLHPPPSVPPNVQYPPGDVESTHALEGDFI